MKYRIHIQNLQDFPNRVEFDLIVNTADDNSTVGGDHISMNKPIALNSAKALIRTRIVTFNAEPAGFEAMLKRAAQEVGEDG